MFRPLLTTACLLVLAACQSPPAAPAADDAPAATPPATVIEGRATYLQRIAPPPGAVLSVELIDNQLADTPAAIVARADFTDLQGPPFAFSLPYDASQLRRNGQYGLHAGLRDAEGRLWFVTDTRVPVTPGAASPVEFRMVQAGAEPTPPIGTTYWQCGDQRIGVRPDTAKHQVALDIGGDVLTLPHATSASGTRYADAAGNTFWSQGTDATLTLVGEPAVPCLAAEQGSPWDAAKARGSVFRGLGTEPGWSVEVGGGEMPRLQAELDYGEQRVDVPQARRTAEGYAGSTGDGRAVSLVTKKESCNDGMSDNTYPASVILTVGDNTYRGCGRFLTE
ncbi:YbaY family lipoprotein [uncultured Pseudoxanthomonas sp.]|uniref:YbaY family lipoprotein n=1 Tax=uncultured Pseudoxanthomonas sp. TaxID=281701 RepID=UPI00261EC696|nr:YbaY family lipoprotein [uncultured Pseudoxanthomonas sp.]